MEREEAIACVAELIYRCRWGALATLCDDGSPLASQVAVAVDRKGPGPGLIMHLSQLAQHTRNLIARPSASLVLGEPDTKPNADPQTLARITVSGTVALLGQIQAEEYDRVRKAYLEGLPAAEPRFEFADFGLYVLKPASGQYVGGFARACSLDQAGMEAALQRVP